MLAALHCQNHPHHLLPARPGLLPGQDQPPSPCVPGLARAAHSFRTYSWVDDWTDDHTNCYVTLENASIFCFYKTSGPELLKMLCDNHVPGVLAPMTRPMAQGQQGEECPGQAERGWLPGRAGGTSAMLTSSVADRGRRWGALRCRRSAASASTPPARR